MVEELPAPIMTARDSRDAWQKLALVALLTMALAALVVGHVSGINGASYHIWAWRRIEASRIYPGMLLAAVPFFVAQTLPYRRSAAPAVVLLMVAMFLLQLTVAGLHQTPFSLWHVADVVEDPLATSYYTDAKFLATQRSFGRFLEEYPDLMQYFALHSRQKPPGLILYYYAMLKWLGDPRLAALVAGVLLGAISALSIPATYLLARQITANREASFAAASYLSLIPSMVLFFPTFDTCYAALTCVILGLWMQAMQSGKVRWALGVGVALSLMLFVTFNLLLLGAFMVGLAIWQIRRRGGAALRDFITISAYTLGTVFAIYLLLYLASGYNPVATFIAAVRNELVIEATVYYPRPYFQTIPSDVQDFLLGSGWISFVLILFYLLRGNPNPVVILGLMQIAIVAGVGLLRCETTRLWAFMQPLAMLPIGLELSRWNRLPRLGVYACLWLLTSAIAQNMKFLL